MCRGLAAVEVVCVCVCVCVYVQELAQLPELCVEQWNTTFDILRLHSHDWHCLSGILQVIWWLRC